MSATNGFETIRVDISDGIATVTLDRPERLNAFNQQMCDEFEELWQQIRLDDDVRVVVLQANGPRAFCTGSDQREGGTQSENPWSRVDPGVQLGPKRNRVWKPVIAALHGMVAGGAFYLVNESDIVICADDTTFFDPHVSYGKTAALEPIGARWRMPLGEVLRMSLLGLDERMSALRAHQVGLVSEVVAAGRLRDRASEIAAVIAHKPPAAVQGTVRAIWSSLDQTRSASLDIGLMFTQVGNPIGKSQAESIEFGKHSRDEWTLR